MKHTRSKAQRTAVPTRLGRAEGMADMPPVWGRLARHVAMSPMLPRPVCDQGLTTAFAVVAREANRSADALRCCSSWYCRRSAASKAAAAASAAASTCANGGGGSGARVRNPVCREKLVGGTDGGNGVNGLQDCWQPHNTDMVSSTWAAFVLSRHGLWTAAVESLGADLQTAHVELALADPPPQQQQQQQAPTRLCPGAIAAVLLGSQGEPFVSRLPTG